MKLTSLVVSVHSRYIDVQVFYLFTHVAGTCDLIITKMWNVHFNIASVFIEYKASILKTFLSDYFHFMLKYF